MSIPDAALEAARDVLYENDRSIDIDYATLEAALEAAAPHMLAGVEAVLSQWDAEAIGNRNTANELRKGSRTSMNRNEIARHEQAAVIAQNHARRMRNAISGTP